MADAIKLDTELNINLRKLDRDIAQISKRISKAGTFQINDKASAPLGRITGNVKDFDSSLNAATQRVVAFGAAAAVFNVLQNAFSNLVKSVINVEDSLAKINVNLGQSKEQIAGFADEIFKAAGATGKTFEEAAKGAEELARQGLGAEETITRLNDALILSRLAGIDTTAAVESLTAAVNSFSSEAVTTTDILNKFVAVDTRFAVSTRDLQEAISRVGTTAGEAGVSLDELNGIVTAVQQSTARGGAVIGNAFKTIFTRLARPETLTQLEELGIAVKDLQGNTLPAIQILKNFAAVQDTLSDAQKQSVKESVAGVFQINILNAALNDLGKNYGVAERAQRASTDATDEAILKNEELNKTLKSQINELGQNFTQLFAKIGEAGASTPLFDFVGAFNQALSSLTGADAEGIGKDIGDGLIKGIANVLSGPGLVIALGALYKAVKLITSSISGDLKGLLDITGQSERRLAVEKQIAVVMASATNEEKENLALATSLVEKKNQLLLIEKRINAERALGGQGNLVSSLAGSSFGRRSKSGVPNFADPLGDAISREKKAGVNPKDIYVGQDSRLISPQNPMGLLVANKRDEPMGGAQGVNRAISEGKNPKTYKGGRGSIPNFAEFDKLERSVRGGKVKDFRGNVTNLPFEEQIGSNEAKQLRSLSSKVRNTANLDEFKKVSAEFQNFAKTLGLTNTSFQKINTVIGNAGNKLNKVLIERRVEELAAAEAASISAKREQKENQIRARDFEKAKKELPVEKIPKIPTEKKQKELTTKQKAAQLLGETKTKKQRDTTAKEIAAFEREQARIEKQNAQRRVTVTRDYVKQQQDAADSAQKIQKEEESVRKKIISDAKKAAKKGTLFQETPGSLLPAQPTAIINSQSRKSPQGISSTQQPAKLSEIRAQQEFGRRNLLKTRQREIEKISEQAGNVVAESKDLSIINKQLTDLRKKSIPLEKSVLEDLKRRVQLSVRKSPEFAGLSTGEIFKNKEIKELFDYRVQQSLDPLTKSNQEIRNARAAQIRNERAVKSFSKAQDVIGNRGLFGREFGDLLALKKAGIDINNPNIKNLVESKKQQRISRAGNIGLGASFLAPLVAGAIPQGKGGTGAGIAGGAASSALNFGATGATIGSFFGPLGIAIGGVGGAAIGGVVGALGKLNKSAEEYAEELEVVRSKEGERINSINSYVQIQEQLNQALKDAETTGNVKTVGLLQSRKSELLSKLSPQDRKTFESLGSNIEDLAREADIQGRRGARSVRQSEVSAQANILGGGLRNFELGNNFFNLSGKSSKAFSQGNNAFQRTGFGDEFDFKKVDELKKLFSEGINTEDLAKLNKESFSNLLNLGSENPNESNVRQVQSIVNELAKTNQPLKDLIVTFGNFNYVTQALADASRDGVKQIKKASEEQLKNAVIQSNAIKRSSLNLFSGSSLEGGDQQLSGFSRLRGSARNKPAGQEALSGAFAALKTLGILGEGGEVSESLGFSTQDKGRLEKQFKEYADIAKAIVNKEKARLQIKQFEKDTGTSLDESIRRGGVIGAIAESLKQASSSQSAQAAKLVPSGKPEIYSGNKNNISSSITRGTTPSDFFDKNKAAEFLSTGKERYQTDKISKALDEFFAPIDKKIKEQNAYFREGLDSTVQDFGAKPNFGESLKQESTVEISDKSLQSFGATVTEAVANLIGEFAARELNIRVDVYKDGQLIQDMNEIKVTVSKVQDDISNLNGRPKPPKTNAKGEYTDPLSFRQRVDLYSKYPQ